MHVRCSPATHSPALHLTRGHIALGELQERLPTDRTLSFRGERIQLLPVPFFTKREDLEPIKALLGDAESFLECCCMPVMPQADGTSQWMEEEEEVG